MTQPRRESNSADTVQACPHRPPCPGCPRFGENEPPPEASTRLAALADEAGIPAPAIESGARGYIDRIDELGGAIRAIEIGFPQKEIHEAAYRWQRRVQSGDAVVVGVNRFTEGDEARPPVLRVDETLQRSRAERLRALRQRRDGAAVERTLTAVEAAARGESNLMPPILDAVEAYATLGEISDTLRAVYGVYQESFSF